MPMYLSHRAAGRQQRVVRRDRPSESARLLAAAASRDETDSTSAASWAIDR